jgi:hypothetical protein
MGSCFGYPISVGMSRRRISGYSYIKEQQGDKSYPDVDTIHGADLETVANLAIAYCVKHPQEMGNTAVQEAISHFGNQP